MKHITLLISIFLITLFAKAQVPVASFSSNSVCQGDITTFIDQSANSPTSWYWDFGDGGGTSTLQNPNYTYAAAGSYNVMFVATNITGSDTIMNVVTVFALPNVNAGPDMSICEGSATQLNASGAATYSWSPSTDLNDPNLAAPISTPLSSITYTLTGVDANGCMATDAVNITVNPVPTINSLTHTQCGENGGDSATFNLTSLENIVNGGSGETVNWYNDPGMTLPIGNPSAFFVDTTDLMVYTQIVDANGCINEDYVQLYIAINDISATTTPSDATCNGSCDGNIILTPSGGTAPYNYSWTPGAITTQDLNNVCAGTYTYTITDVNGCIYFADATVNEPLPITIALTPYNVSCFGANDGYISSSVSGGNGTYAYQWNDPGNQVTATATNLGPGNYSLAVVDGNGCTASNNATITEPTPDGVIAGIVNYQGSPIDMGAISLIRKDGATPADLTLIGVHPINTGGYFEFQNVEAGLYLLKARGDTTLYNCVPTYSDGTIQWDLALEWDITSNCSNDSQYVSIDLIEVPVNTGSGSITGQLIENDGSLINKAPGDPIGDIDITVEQSPGGAIMGATTTDPSGYFSFNDLPDGSYTVYADMHGYSMNISGTIDLSGGNNNIDVTLCSDDTTLVVGMCNNNPTNVKENIAKSEISIYPNPAKDVLNITTPQKETFNLSITDITGKTVLNKKLITQYNQIDVAQFVTGIYFVRIYNEQTNIYQKLIIE